MSVKLKRSQVCREHPKSRFPKVSQSSKPKVNWKQVTKQKVSRTDIQGGVSKDRIQRE